MTIVTTTHGDVAGARHADVLRFAGIPYGAPPVGELRFAAPRPPEPWSGVRPADDFGPISLQNPSPLESTLGAQPLPQSEDCLSLNVYTPAVDEARRPVMVWIHGGAFVTGTGSTPLYDGKHLAARGDVVVVTVNYRLGALGFLHLGGLDESLGSSGLNGILDQVAALEWVRDNVAAFGGDPDNVTIFGESAGGMSVGTLLALPAARGLFRRAIAQSGAGHHVVSLEQADLRTRRFCEITGCSTVEELRALDGSIILDAQAKLGLEIGAASIANAGDLATMLAFQPVVDGEHLDDSPIERARRGEIAEADLLIGTTEEEWRLFSMMAPAPESDDELAGRFATVFDDPAAALETYRSRLGAEAPVKDVFDAVMTDAMFRVPMHRLADATVEAGNRAWLYRFAYRSPAMGGALGACHALEIPFVFDRRGGPVAGFVGQDSPDELAHAMQQAWLAFARHGDPNHDAIPTWEPQQGERRPVIRFDHETTVTDDPELAELALWNGVL